VNDSFDTVTVSPPNRNEYELEVTTLPHMTALYVPPLGSMNVTSDPVCVAVAVYEPLSGQPGISDIALKLMVHVPVTSAVGGAQVVSPLPLPQPITAKVPASSPITKSVLVFIMLPPHAGSENLGAIAIAV
jgi:hypothetical protein